MLLTFVIILLVIGASVVGSIYSGFLTFYKNFQETDNYNKAYYASIAGLERAELAIRQRKPGYEGNGGRQNGVSTGNSVNGSNTGDGIESSTGFSYLSDKNRATNLFRSIKSKAGRIPQRGAGDIDLDISLGATDYNKMDYEDAEVFLLSYDRSNGNPYRSGDVHIVQSTINSITGEIRLPESLTGKFGTLNTGSSLVTFSNKVKNDPIVDRQIRGNYDGSQFTIYSFSDANVTNGRIGNRDSVIRESDINGVVKLNFNKSKSPITKNYVFPERTIISEKDTDLSVALNEKLSSVFNNQNITGVQLRLSLLNILQGSGNAIYPYLEYYLDFGNEVSDKYYTINAEGKVGEFLVNLIVKKPTIKESVFGNFTVIF